MKPMRRDYYRPEPLSAGVNGVYGTDQEACRQTMTLENRFSQHTLSSNAETNLLIDAEILDLEDERTRAKVGLWEDFVNNADAGRDIIANGTHEVSSEDVQEGLEQATETFIPLNAKRENSRPATASNNTDVAGAGSIKEPPTPVLADLIEFD